MRFTADEGTTWSIEASIDLVHWTEIGTRTATASAVTFTDDPVEGVTQRFYRLRKVE